VVNYNKKEKSEAKRMGATLHKNSGRGRVKKGDGTWRRFIVDWKFAKKSFALNKDVWSKVVTDTLKSDREKNPALIIVLGEGQDIVRLAIIEQEILEQLDNDDNDMV
jgi:outer membrane phospholipase A